MSQLPQPCRVDAVRSLEDGCRRVEHNLAVVREQFGGQAALQGMARAMRGLTMSTCFSGIGCPEVTLGCITHGLRQFVDSNVPDPPHEFACDMRGANREELMMLTGSDCCIFGNVEDFLPEALQVLKSEAHRMELDDLSAIFSRQNSVLDTGFCWRHKQRCTCRRATVHVAGPPCPAFSSLGKHQGAVGPLLLPLMIWTAHRALIEEDFILHENVPGFPVQLLIDMLGSKYSISTQLVQVADLGQPVDRLRRWTWLTHKRIAGIVHPPCAWPSLPGLLHRSCETSWRAYLRASTEELTAMAFVLCNSLVH